MFRYGRMNCYAASESLHYSEPHFPEVDGRWALHLHLFFKLVPAPSGVSCAWMTPRPCGCLERCSQRTSFAAETVNDASLDSKLHRNPAPESQDNPSAANRRPRELNYQRRLSRMSATLSRHPELSQISPGEVMSPNFSNVQPASTRCTLTAVTLIPSPPLAVTDQLAVATSSRQTIPPSEARRIPLWDRSPSTNQRRPRALTPVDLSCRRRWRRHRPRR